MSLNLPMTERFAACLESFQSYLETGNDCVELKNRLLVDPAPSALALLQAARRRKSRARRRLLLHQGPGCCSCPNRIRPT